MAAVSLRFAAPEEIRQASGGEVRHPGGFDPETGRPQLDGLFCERIFGSTKDRSRLGQIDLAVPVLHPWALWAPHPAAVLLDLPRLELEKLPAPLIRERLAALDLEQLAGELRAELAEELGRARRARWIRRLEAVEALRSAGTRPEWLVLEVLPVLPPALRPPEGPRASLNAGYRRILHRNARLRQLQESQAPEAALREEAARLQQAVNALFAALWSAGPGASARPAPLRQLTALMHGQPPPPEPPSGPAVGFAGSAVVVPDPALPLDRCGLPREVALRLFRPFVVRRLLETGAAAAWAAAEQQVDRALRGGAEEAVETALEAVTRDHPLLVACDPVRDLPSLRAFLPVLHASATLRVHPVNLQLWLDQDDREPGFRAHIHVPLSAAAQAEARRLLPSRNLRDFRNGGLACRPARDIILGLYYLTEPRDWSRDAESAFASPAEALQACEAGALDLRAPIRVRLEDPTPDGKPERRWVETTAGRLRLNEILPLRLQCSPHRSWEWPWDHGLQSGDAIQMVTRFHEEYGGERTIRLLEELSALGLQHATRSGISLSVTDFRPPAERDGFLAEAEKEVARANRAFQRGVLNEEERRTKVLHYWQRAASDVGNAVMAHIDRFNPIFIMANSGARGSKRQITQLSGMRGLCSYPLGRLIEDLPIKSNFHGGLSVLEFFVSTLAHRGSRGENPWRSQVVALLVRGLAGAAGPVVIRAEDCGDTEGLLLSDLRDGRELVERLETRIRGRYVLAEVVDRESGAVLARPGEPVGDAAASAIGRAEVREVAVRSPLRCRLREGLCARCYGCTPGEAHPPPVGARVGLHAAFAAAVSGDFPERWFGMGLQPAPNVWTDGTPERQAQEKLRLLRRNIEDGLLELDEELSARERRRVFRLHLRVFGWKATGRTRIWELLEARRPREEAILSPVAGTVAAIDRHCLRREVIIHTEERIEDGPRIEAQVAAVDLCLPGTETPVVRAGETITAKQYRQLRDAGVRTVRLRKSLMVPCRGNLEVDQGDTIRVGDSLTWGLLEPHQALAFQGAAAVEAYLLRELQCVFKNSGIDVSDPYFEVLLREMLRYRRILCSGDTRFLPDQEVDHFVLEAENRRFATEGGAPATAERVLRSISQVAKQAGGWLAALGELGGRRAVAEAALAGRSASISRLDKH